MKRQRSNKCRQGLTTNYSEDEAHMNDKPDARVAEGRLTEEAGPQAWTPAKHKRLWQEWQVRLEAETKMLDAKIKEGGWLVRTLNPA